MEDLYVDSTWDIKFHDMILPINSELFDKWILTRLGKAFGPETLTFPSIKVSFEIIYVPDKLFMKVMREDLKKPSKWQFWKWPIYWRTYYKTRGMSYAGKIYIKRSAHADRALLFHEIGHNVLFLEHTLRPGIMNPISLFWGIKGRHVR